MFASTLNSSSVLSTDLQVPTTKYPYNGYHVRGGSTKASLLVPLQEKERDRTESGRLLRPSASPYRGSDGGGGGGPRRLPSVSLSVDRIDRRIIDAQETVALSDLMTKTLGTKMGTALFSAVLAISTIFFLAMASVGVRHLENCPAQPKIPVYLLVGGCFWLLKLISLLWLQMRRHRNRSLAEERRHTTTRKDNDNATTTTTTKSRRHDDDYDDDYDDGVDLMRSRSSRFSEVVLNLFLFVWCLCGSYWVFGAWKTPFHPTMDHPSRWCHVTAYMFAMTQLVLNYVIAFIVVVGLVVMNIVAWRQNLLEN